MSNPPAIPSVPGLILACVVAAGCDLGRSDVQSDDRCVSTAAEAALEAVRWLDEQDPDLPGAKQEVVSQLEELLAGCPGSPVVQRELGLLLLHLERPPGKTQGLRTRHDERAHALLLEALRLDPESPETALALENYHVLMGEHEQALEFSRSVTARDPTNTNARLAEASDLLKLGRFDEAAKVARSLVDDLAAAPERQAVYFSAVAVLADIEQNRGDAAAARHSLEQAVGLGGDGSQAAPREELVACSHLALGQLYLSEGDEAAALELALQAAEIEGSHELLFRAARGLFLAGRHKEALTYCDRALAVVDSAEARSLRGRIVEEIEAGDASAEQPPEAWFERALLAFDLEEYGRAHRAIQRAQAIRSTERQLVVSGLLQLLRHEQDGVETTVTELRELGADGPGLRLLEAHVLLGRNQPAQARGLLEPLLPELESGIDRGLFSPSRYEWVLFRMAALGVGWSLGNEGRFEDAIPSFERVLFYAPGDSLALLGKGNALIPQGRLDEAARCFERVLERDGDNRQALSLLGLVAYNRGDTVESTRLQERAAELAPASYSCPYEGMGMAYLRQGSTEKAERSFEKAIELNPDIEYRKYNGLARLRMGQGDWAEARRLLEISLRNNPGGAEAQALLEQVEEASGQSATAE
ncbi:MAG: tetratricopeptide repeat protein [Pseudomonadota bacterium]